MSKQLFTKLFHFPPPAYLSMPSVGLNLSDHSIKLMELRQRGSLRVPFRWASIAVADGIVERGDVKKPEELKGILKELKKEFELEFIRASIPEEQAYIFSTEIPREAAGHLNETIEFQLQDYVPLSPQEAVFDCDVIAKSKKGESLLVNVSVLPRSVIDEYMNIFSEAGLVPLSFEMEGQTIARAVVPKDSNKTYFIVDIGRTRTGLSIVSNGVLAYTSTLDLGGDMFTKAVSEHLKLDPQEAEKVKQEEGFTRRADNEELYMSLVNVVSVFRDEINKRIGYWQSHHVKHDRERQISGIILTGGNASVPGLKDHFEASLSVPVRLGNVWTNLFSFNDYIPSIDFRHSLTYASTIGLALSTE